MAVRAVGNDRAVVDVLRLRSFHRVIGDLSIDLSAEARVELSAHRARRAAAQVIYIMRASVHLSMRVGMRLRVPIGGKIVHVYVRSLARLLLVRVKTV